MAKWQNGQLLDSQGLPASDREDLRNTLQAYVKEVRTSLEKERDYLIEYHRRLSGRDVLDKDVAALTLEEVEKLLG
jgi:hypothetical protein